MLSVTVLLALLNGWIGCGGPVAGPPPVTEVRMVEEELHDVKVQDPFRWLEDGESPESRQWVEEQSAYWAKYLDQVASRDRIRTRMAEILGSGSISTPVEAGGRYYYSRREGGQDQPVVYMREGLHGEDRALLDPNAMSSDGTTTVDWYVPSKDGKMLAFGMSTEGTETSTMHILDIESGDRLDDVFPKVRFANPQWLKDGSGFYYSRPRDIDSIGPGEELYDRRVFFHKLGRHFEQDPVVFGEGLEKAHIPDGILSDDERYLILDTFLGWGRNHLYVRDLATGRTVTIAEDGEFSYSGEILDNTLFLLTNADAPRYRVVAVDLRNPKRSNWRTVIPESEDVVEFAAIAGRRLFVGRMRDAHSELYSYALDGSDERQIQLPGLGTVSSFSSKQSRSEAFFSFSSFVRAPTIFRIEEQESEAARWEGIESPVDSGAFEVRQVFYPSKDGTRIPMYLIAKHGTPSDGSVAGLLYGYGGFNIALTPSYSTWIFPWIEAGNVLAIANLRGGSEYGEEWHKAGMLGNKQNVFDDFIAAGEYLRDEGLVDPDRLVIHGRSNGGLLVGAALTQRPDLWRAAVSGVPLLDMLRYDKFRMAKLWVSEYGTADNPEDFQWLHAYSPYHRVEEGVGYPATLIYTADSDSRVDPMHARKMVARLQAATSSDEPILLRYEESAGHGRGKPLHKVVDEWADIWSFIFAQI
jgi:prolyl oligopeptidase